MPIYTKFISLSLMFLAAVAVQGCAQQEMGQHNGSQQGSSHQTTYVARYVDKAPVVDGISNDTAWEAASEITGLAKMGHGGGSMQFTMKTVHTDNSVYFLFRWADQTASVRKSEWVFDGTTWAKSAAQEDRVALIIQAADGGSPMRMGDGMGDGNGNGNGDGGAGMHANSCANYCHENASPPYMATDTPSLYVDVWHWKAARTNPMGFADDQHLQSVVDYSSSEVTGRRADEGTSTYMNNGDIAPLFAPADGGLYITSDNIIPFDENADWKAGDTIPGYVLRAPDGSRADVMAKGTYKDGVWTLEITRAKTTSDSVGDQAILDDGSYMVSVAIWDNDHGDKHYKSPMNQVTFSR